MEDKEERNLPSAALYFRMLHEDVSSVRQLCAPARAGLLTVAHLASQSLIDGGVPAAPAKQAIGQSNPCMLPELCG